VGACHTPKGRSFPIGWGGVLNGSKAQGKSQFDYQTAQRFYQALDVLGEQKLLSKHKKEGGIEGGGISCGLVRFGEGLKTLRVGENQREKRGGGGADNHGARLGQYLKQQRAR